MLERTVVIIGGGIAGLSAAWWLTRMGGARVTVLEKEPGPGRHSSSLNAAILRSASGPWPLPSLARETAELLTRPPSELAQAPLLDRCGLLLLGDDLDPEASQAESVDQRGMRALAPRFRPRGERALWYPDDGRIDIHGLLRGLARAVRARGGELRTGASVRRLEVSGAQVHGAVLENDELVRADWTVLAAGGWAGLLASAAGSPVRLRPTRRHLLLTRPDRRIERDWPIVWDETAGFYARPEAGGLLLCACDRSSVDPDACAADPAQEPAILERARECLPELDGLQRERFWAGMRTFGPDALPLVGRDPSLAGLFWSAGLGGHGMTTSLATGRIAAEGLLDRVSDPDVAHALSPERLALSGARIGR